MAEPLPDSRSNGGLRVNPWNLLLLVPFLMLITPLFNSDQPRLLVDVSSEVPPTAVTNLDAAGYPTPKPSSPELAVMATPGWLKNISASRIDASSGPP